MAKIFKNTLRKKISPRDNYFSETPLNQLFLKIGSIIRVDLILQRASVKLLDGYGNDLLDVPFSLTKGHSYFFGVVPCVGDVVLVGYSKGIKDKGRPFIVSFLPHSNEATRTSSFSYSPFQQSYLFTYTRFPTSGDPYLKSSSGSELHLTENVLISSGGFSKVEINSSSETLYEFSRNKISSFSGIYSSIGVSTRPLVFFEGNDIKSYTDVGEYSFQELKDSGEKASNRSKNSIDSAIKPVLFTDGTSLAYVTKDDNSKNPDNGGKPYVEMDYNLSEFYDILPIIDSSSDLLDPKIFKIDKGEGDSKEGYTAIRFGVGTKIGNDISQKSKYARPLSRNVFDPENQETFKFKYDEDSTKELTSHSDVKDKGVAAWYNLYRDGKELGFIEVMKTGAIKILSRLKFSDKDTKGNALDLNLLGRVKTSFGEVSEGTDLEDISGDEKKPSFNKSDKEETILSYIQKAINIFVQGKDSKGNSWQLQTKEGSIKIKSGGESHFQSEKISKSYFKDACINTVDKFLKYFVGESTIYKVSKLFSVETGTGINLAIKGNAPAKVGFGATINENSGSMSGGATFTITVNGSEVEVSTENLENLTVKNLKKIVLEGSKLYVGSSGGNPVGVKGSTSRVAGHTIATLDNNLSTKLFTDGGSSSSANSRTSSTGMNNG